LDLVLGRREPTQSLNRSGPLTLAIVLCGLCDSLGPLLLSAVPITWLTMAGFRTIAGGHGKQSQFCGGIVLSLVALGGQWPCWVASTAVPRFYPLALVAVLAW